MDLIEDYDDMMLDILCVASKYFFKNNKVDKVEVEYLMKVETHDIVNINNYAMYCRNEKKNDLMELLLYLGISLGSSESMFLLGWFYTKLDNNMMEYFYLAAIEKGMHKLAYNYLLAYYIKNNDFVSLQKTIRTDIELLMHVEYQIPFEYLINIPLRHMTYTDVPRTFLKDNNLKIIPIHKNGISYMCIVNDN